MRGWDRNTGPSRRPRRSWPVCGPPRRLAFEQAPARHTELAGDVAGDQLGLVEATLVTPAHAGRRPGDDVDALTGGRHPVDDETCQVAGDGAAVAVLEAEQHVADTAGEGRGDEHTGRPVRLGAADQGEAAGPAQRRAGPLAAGASGREDHAADHGRGVRECDPVAPADQHVRLPDPCLVVLVGVAGAGKSTWAGQWFPPPAIVAPDDLRAVVGRHRHDLQATKDALEVLDLVVSRRLGRGLLTVVDSTALDASVRARVPGPGCVGRRAVPRRHRRHPRARRLGRATGSAPRRCRPRSSRASSAPSPQPGRRSPTRGLPASTGPATARSSSSPVSSSTHRRRPAARRNDR